jgi:hypothetical protein
MRPFPSHCSNSAMNIHRPSNGIARTLAFWFCASSVVLTLILAQIIGNVATDTLRRQIGQQLSELAYQTTEKLDQGMFERYREVQLVADNSGIGDPGIPLKRKQRLLDDIQETYAYYAWFGMTDTAGRVVAAAQGVLAGADISQRPWFIKAMSGTSNIGDLHDAKLLAKMLPDYAAGGPLRFIDIAFPYHDPMSTMNSVSISPTSPSRHGPKSILRQ